MILNIFFLVWDTSDFFVRNSILNNFYLKLFLMWCVFLVASNLKPNLLDCFWTLLFFEGGNLSSPLAPLQREINICACGLFCTKFNFEQLLFKAFFWCDVYFWLHWAPNRIHFPVLNIGTFTKNCGVAFLISWLVSL